MISKDLKKEILEMKRMLKQMQEKLERIEAEAEEGVEETVERNNPFFKKGHRLPQIVIADANLFSGRYLTLKVLYELGKPASAEEISEITGRSKKLEATYLSGLKESKLVQKDGDKYTLTEQGSNFAKALISAGGKK